MVKDPVCNMDIDEKKAQFQSNYKNKNYYFCSKACKEKFDNTISNLKKASGGICFGVIVEKDIETRE